MGRVLGRSGNCSERTCGRSHVILPTPPTSTPGIYTRYRGLSLSSTPLSGSGENVKEFPVPAAELPIRGQRLCYYPARQFGRLFFRRVALCRHRSLRRSIVTLQLPPVAGDCHTSSGSYAPGSGTIAGAPSSFRSVFAHSTHSRQIGSRGPSGVKRTDGTRSGLNLKI